MVRTAKPVPRKFPLRSLREHRSIHWPPGIEPNPAWAGPSPEVPNPSRVTLITVELVREAKGPGSHLVLTGQYDGNPYRTTLTIDEPALLANLCDTLRRCIGETIEQIGAHRVDRTLKLV
jgi:hypothetical protein